MMEPPPRRKFGPKEVDLAETVDAAVREKAWKMLGRYSEILYNQLGGSPQPKTKLSSNPARSPHIKLRTGKARILVRLRKGMRRANSRLGLLSPLTVSGRFQWCLYQRRT